jgi:hypothetical protein
MTAKPRKILLVTYGRPFGGAEIYAGRLAQLLKDHATFYALCGNAHLASYLSSTGIKVFSYHPRLRKGIWWKLEYFLICAIMLPYFKWRYHVDTIWIQLSFCRLLGSLAIPHSPPCMSHWSDRSRRFAIPISSSVRINFCASRHRSPIASLPWCLAAK